MAEFFEGSSVHGDAFALLAVLLSRVHEDGLYGELLSLALLDEKGLAGRWLGFDEQRMSMAVAQLKANGEIRIVETETERGFVVERWGQFKEAVARAGAREYQRMRRAAKREAVAA